MPIPSLRAMPLLMLALLSCAPSVQAADAGACRYVPVATLPLRGATNNSRPLVDGSINGKPATMLVSTGFPYSMLAKDSAEKFGIPLGKNGHNMQGIGGASVSYKVQVRDFSVGDVHSGKTEMTLLGNMASQLPYDAMLGADFALQMDLEISLAERQFKFFRANDCKDTFLAYWSADAIEVPFGGTQTRHPNPRFIVEINGVKMEASINTGSARTSISRAAAETAGIRLDAPNVVPAGTLTGIGETHLNVWDAEVDSFTIGSEVIKNAHIVIRDAAPQGTTIAFPDIMIGDDFLRAHRVLIAMSQRRLYISYLGGEVFPRRRVRNN